MPQPLIQSFVSRAIPYPHNRKFHSHETAVLIVFIREETREAGIETFRKVLARERWQLLKLDSHTRENEDELSKEGSLLLLAGYKHALIHGDWIHVIPDHFGAGKKKPFGLMQGLRLTEEHIDRIISRAGGIRYLPDGPEERRPRNADYIFCDHIVELKEIRENALDKTDRKVRLGALFENCLPDDLTMPLDPSLLSPDAANRFFEIIAEPIRRQVKSAVGQIRATREALGRPEMPGGLILINSGTHVIYHKLFHELAAIEAGRYPDIFRELTSISTWFLTNGFNYNINFAIHPAEPVGNFQESFGKAYQEEISHIMGEWARSGFMPPEDSLPVSHSIGFDYKGRSFYWEPTRLPNTMGLPEPIL